jgi:aspartate 1-decarboxylase
MKLRTYLQGKIHRAVVTGAELEYEGSISICPELIAACGLHLFERVDIYNVDNGERFSTYVIEGGPGEICLNGAAAHKGSRGHRVIIAAYTQMDAEAAAAHVPQVVLVGEGNRIKSVTPERRKGQ